MLQQLSPFVDPTLSVLPKVTQVDYGRGSKPRFPVSQASTLTTGPSFLQQAYIEIFG